MSDTGTSFVAKPAAEVPAAAVTPPPAEAPKPAGTGPEVKADTTLAGGAETPAPAPATTDGKPAATEAPKVEAAWPDDWREQMAGNDTKLLKMLKRYASPNTVATGFHSLRSRLDAGEFKKGLEPDATEDEVAQYRKDNGIPDKPEAYAMPEGLQIGEEDKPIIDDFLKSAHSRNLPPSEVQANIKWFYAAQEQMRAQMAEADLARRAEAEDTLRNEWGNEFRSNINGIKGWLQGTAPADGFMDRFLGGRLADGTLIGNDPEVLKWLDARRREENPYPTTVGNGQASPLQSIEDELAALTKRMGTKEWYQDDKAQSRFRELTELKGRFQKAA